MKIPFLISFFLFFISSQHSFGQEAYSFFVAGHTYGEPLVNNEGVHPPFKQKFSYLNSRPEIELGFLTGDIVSPFPLAQDWDEIDQDISILGIPVYFAAGNHDMENRPLFEQRYGKTYYFFKHRGDLFIALDPNLDGWNISGQQLQFLKNTLLHEKDSVDNIFVFFHQVLWKSDYNQFNYIQWNSAAGRSSGNNFWLEVVPLFLALPNQVVMFAGDVGAKVSSSNVTYDEYENITFIASGMGDNEGDNIVVVNVVNDKSIEYDLICLSDTNPGCLGDLKDYKVVDGMLKYSHPNLYPNPAYGFFNISLKEATSYNIQIFDRLGHLVLSDSFENDDHYKVNLNGFATGLYFVRLFNRTESWGIKLFVD